MVTVLPVPVEEGTNKLAKIVAVCESLLSGAIAGAVAKTVIAPADRVKIMYQVDPSRAFSLGNAARTGVKVYEEGGVRALWAGNTATMLRVVPYASLTFMSFEHYHNAFRRLVVDEKSNSQGSAVFARFCAGSMAGATATAATYPLDLLRARFAAHNDTLHPRYPSYSTAFREMISNEGPRALYSGVIPTLLGIIPYAGCNFAVFETLKHYLTSSQNLESDKGIPVYQRLMAAGFSGLVAQSATYPLDIVRRRMQVHVHAPGVKRRGIAETLTHIYKNEGLKQGLFKGLQMNWIKGPIATSVSFTTNDLIKGRIGTYNKLSKEDTPVVDFELDKRLTTFEATLCGAVAGGLAKLWTIPFDRIKIMYTVGQVTIDEHSSGPGHIVSRLREQLKDTHNMWQGSAAVLARVVPYAAICYAVYESDTAVRASQRITYSTENGFLSNFARGAAACSVATLMLHPLDLARVRLATSPGRQTSFMMSMRGMVNTGGYRALYEGAGPALIGIVPMGGIGFAVYEHLKHRMSPNGEDPGFPRLLCAGAAAGAVAQGLTYPLNVVRRKAMVDAVVYDGLVSSLRTIYTQGGFYDGLYRRLPFSWALGASTVGISFAIFDEMRVVTLAARHELKSLVKVSQPLWVAEFK